jgi:hypothetical protein
VSSLAHAVIGVLTSDVTLTEALYGGIYDRPPRKDGGVEATPDAFEPSGAIKPCASIFVDESVRFGPGQVTRPVRVRVRGPKTEGTAPVEASMWLVYALRRRGLPARASAHGWAAAGPRPGDRLLGRS